MPFPSANGSQTCRAALFHGAGLPLEYRSFPLPEPGVNEALIEIECCTLCGSDLHTLTGSRQEKIPSILGHEILGRVKFVRDPPLCDIQGNSLTPGDRITWSVTVSCQNCDRCLQGYPQKCRELVKYGHELATGRTALSGGLAEYILLRQGSTVVRVPDELPAELICPVNCATATIMAAYRVAGSVAGKRVLILGAGMLGLTAAAFAKSHHASHVVVSDLNPDRLQVAKRFGTDSVALWQDDTKRFQAELLAVSGGDHFDLILELSGSAAAVERAFELGEIGAQIVLVGTVMTSRLVKIDPEQVVRRWLSIHGVHNYTPQDLQSAVDFLCSQYTQFPFESLVEKSYSLADLNAAIKDAIPQKPIRIAIRP